MPPAPAESYRQQLPPTILLEDYGQHTMPSITSTEGYGRRELPPEIPPACDVMHDELYQAKQQRRMFIVQRQESITDSSGIRSLSGLGDAICVQLDISVHSPSDSEHWHRYLTFEPDLPSEDCAFPLTGQSPMLLRPEYDDHKHGWRAGRQVSLPGRMALDKTFEEIVELGPFEDEAQGKEWWGQLPLAPAVTSLLMCQQTCRRWKQQTLGWLLSRFPKLQELCYEPWREWVDGMQIITDQWFEGLFGSLASRQPQLQRLVLFENFVPEYTGNQFLCSPSRILSPGVSHAVCSASLRLEQLSASFIVEANHFFDCVCKHTTWVWANLTSVALTTRLLVAGADLTRIEDMLREAAATAMRMPKLENMEIWNGEKGSAMLFRYQHRQPHSRPGRERSAMISWKGT